MKKRFLITALIIALIFVGIILPMLRVEKHPKNSSAFHKAFNGKQLLVSRDYAKIQDAINAAKPGDIVKIMPGIYEESLTLKDGIALEGEDCNKVVILCDMRVSPVLTIADCNNIRISRLTLKHYTQLPLDESSLGNWPVVQIDDSAGSLSRLIVCDSGLH